MKNKRQFLFCYVLIMTLAAVLCIGSAILMIIQDIIEYNTSKKEYSNVVDEFVSFEGDTEVDDSVASDEYSNVEEVFTSGAEVLYDEYPKVKIDHMSLSSVNSDYVGWLYIPVLDISYPVVQGIDNEYYLTHTFQKTENKSGAIFVDAYATTEDFDVIFYGHSMKDGTMFQKLKRFDRDRSLCKTDPYIYFYKDNKVYKFEVYSYYTTTVDSETYRIINNNVDYKYFVDYNLEQSDYNPDRSLNYTQKSITLSTCYGNNPDERYVVNAIFVDSYNIN